MIIEALVSMLSALVTSVADMFGSLTLPEWWVSLDGSLSSLGEYAAGYGEWVPVAEAVTALGFVVGALALALTIKLVRIVVSLFTAGGGSAA